MMILNKNGIKATVYSLNYSLDGMTFAVVVNGVLDKIFAVRNYNHNEIINTVFEDNAS